MLIHQAFVTRDEAGGTRHYELSRYLVRDGFKVTVVASRVSYLTGRAQSARSSHEVVDGIEVRRSWIFATRRKGFFPWLLGFVSFMLSSFVAALRVPRVDVVWGTSPPIFQATTAYIVARLRRKPFCLEIRDLWPATLVETGVLTNRLAIWASEWLERRLYKGADRIVVNSPGFIPHLVTNGARRENIYLVSNSVDVPAFQTDKDGVALKAEWGCAGKFVAVYAGAHGQANDLPTLLQAASLLREYPDIRVVLVGDGKEKARVVRQAREMGLSNVLFVPPQPKAKMPEVLAAADVCVAILKPAPLYRTVYPNKVFDYMAASKPTILAIDGVIRQVIEEAQGGVFVPPGDARALAQAIRSYADDPGLCHQHGRNARAHVVAHFDRTQQAEELARVFAGLTS